MHRILIPFCVLGLWACITVSSVERSIDLRFDSSIALQVGAPSEAGELQLTNRGTDPVRVIFLHLAEEGEGLEQPIGIAEIEPEGAWEFAWEGGWRLDIESLGAGQGRVALEIEGSPRATFLMLDEG